MKKLLLGLLFIGLTTSCEGLKYTHGQGELKKDYVTNDLSAKENYILANEWMVEAFNNAESVIQFSDKEAGIVRGKYSLYSGWGNGYYSIDKVTAIITLRTKDNGVVIEIDTRGQQYTVLHGTDPLTLQKVSYGYNSTKASKDINALLFSFKNRLSN